MNDNRIKTIAASSVAAISLLALWFFPLAAGWGAEPNVYVVFWAILILFLIAGIFYLRQHKYFSVNVIDVGLLVWGLYMLGRQVEFGAERMQNDLLLSFTILFFFYIASRMITKTTGLITVVFNIIAISGALEFLIGCYQSIRDFGTENTLAVSGTFTNANTFCAYLTVCLPFIYQLISKFNGNSQRAAFIIRFSLVIIMLGAYVMIFYLGSRGAIIAAFATLILFYVPQIKGVWKGASTITKVIVVIVALQALIYGFFLMIEKRDSANGREFVWLRCWEMIKEKPLLGYGWGGFEKTYMFFQERFFRLSPNNFYKPLADDIVYPFNIFLEIAIAAGVIGLILFLAVIVFAFTAKKASRNSVMVTCWGVLATFLINGFFSYTLQSTPILLIVLFCLAVLSRQTKSVFKAINRYCILAPVIFAGVIAVYLIPQYIAHRHWKKGVQNILTDEDYGLEQYALASKTLYQRGTFLYNYGTTLFELRNYTKSNDVLKQASQYMNTTYLQVYRGKAEEALNNIDSAEHFFKIAINMTPKLFYPRYYLLQLYINTCQKSKADHLAKQIVLMEEKIPSNHTRFVKEFANDYLQGKQSEQDE